MKIVLVRHGFSESNEKRLFSGSQDVSLSAIGRKELLSLKKEKNYPVTDYYVTSTLMRTKQTFEILYPDKKINMEDSRFSELFFGDYEGTPLDDIDLDDYFKRIYNNENINNNEIFSDFYKRIENGLIDLITNLNEKNMNSVTIVTHFTVIKTIVTKAIDDTYEQYLKIRTGNGLGYILDISVENGKLVYNSCEEL